MSEPKSDSELLAQLTVQNEQLEQQVMELSELLARSELVNAQLSDILDASAEDLQLVGTLWIKPSAVRLINFQTSGGIHIDGVSVELDNRAPNPEIAAQMQSFALEINRMNATRRDKAKARKINQAKEK